MVLFNRAEKGKRNLVGGGDCFHVWGRVNNNKIRRCSRERRGEHGEFDEQVKMRGSIGGRETGTEETERREKSRRVMDQATGVIDCQNWRMARTITVIRSLTNLNFGKG